MHLRTSTLILLGLVSPTVHGQVASSLLNENDALPGAPGHTVTSLSNTSVNQVGGYAVSLNADNGGSTISHVWGNATGGAGAPLATEGTFGPLTQTSFESFYGIDDAGNVCYSASGTGGPVGGFDSVWVNSTPIAVEGDPSSVSGMFWRFASRPGITADGKPYFVGGITSTSGGSTENRGLFFGPTGTAVILGGQSLTGLPFALDTAASNPSFDYRYSSLGNHYIAEVDMNTGSTSDDGAMIIDGVGLMAGGSLVREGDLVPVSIGGDGVEAWDNFDFTGINEAGSWFFTGDTDGSSSTDEIVVRDGTIILREGQTVDGLVLNGSIEGAFMNEAGDLALIWDVDTVGGNVEVLIVNGSIALMEGDEVDFDNDGLVDAGVLLTNFTGISALTLDANRNAYFTADFDDNGAGDVEGFFKLPCNAGCTGQTYCTSKINSLGCTPAIAAAGAPSVSNPASFDISADMVLNNKAGILFYGFGPNALPFQGGFLCVQPPTKRTPVQSSGGNPPPNDCSGTFSLDFNALIQSGTDPSLTAGTQVFSQYWSRDPASPSTTSLTGGLSFIIGS